MSTHMRADNAANSLLLSQISKRQPSPGTIRSRVEERVSWLKRKEGRVEGGNLQPRTKRRREVAREKETRKRRDAPDNLMAVAGNGGDTRLDVGDVAFDKEDGTREPAIRTFLFLQLALKFRKWN